MAVCIQGRDDSQRLYNVEEEVWKRIDGPNDRGREDAWRSIIEAEISACGRGRTEVMRGYVITPHFFPGRHILA